MTRKIVLLVEAEQPEGLSARKIILESLSHHVVTARNRAEAMALLDRVQPDIAMVHSHIDGESCEETITEICRRVPNAQIVALTPGATSFCGPVVTIDSMRPQDLVKFFESPANTRPI